MKRAYKIAVILFAVLLLSSFVTSCGCNIIGSVVFNNFYKYDDFEKYSAGNFSCSSSEINSIDIEWRNGKIELVKAEGENIYVTESSADISDIDDDMKVHCYVKNGTLYIKFCAAGYKYSKINDKCKHLKVCVPKNADVDIDTVSSDINIGDAVFDRLSIDVISGNVDGQKVNADKVNIETTSGSISFESLIAKNADFDTVSGNIKIKELGISGAEINSVSGYADIALSSKADIDFSSVSGSITIELPDGIGAKARIDSVSGVFHSKKTFTEEKKDVYVIGNGECLFDIDTTSGDVYIN